MANNSEYTKIITIIEVSSSIDIDIYHVPIEKIIPDDLKMLKKYHCKVTPWWFTSESSQKMDDEMAEEMDHVVDYSMYRKEIYPHICVDTIVFFPYMPMH